MRARILTIAATVAGPERTQTVLNRKGTAAPMPAIIPGMESACGNWKWRREHCVRPRTLTEPAGGIPSPNPRVEVLLGADAFVSDQHAVTAWGDGNLRVSRPAKPGPGRSVSDHSLDAVTGERGVSPHSDVLVAGSVSR
jgi:hypothetical protein